MKKGRHPITQDQIQGLCIICNIRKQQAATKSVLGYKKYIKFCSTCAKEKYGDFSKSYLQIKKPHCEKCGFVAIDKCQLDVHHIDRNHKNNHVDNLLTLCANCHRLEHIKDRLVWGHLSQG